MPKHVSLQNTLLIGLIWSVFYLGLGAFLVNQWYHFQILSLTSWVQLISDFKQGYFQVNSWSSLGFFAILLIFYPLWLFSWHLLRGIDLIGAFKKIRVPRTAKTSAKTTGPKKFIPQKINMQTGVVFTIAPTQTNTAQNMSEQPIPSKTPEQPDLNVNAADDIIDFARAFQAESFKNLKINNQSLDLSLATDEKALLIVLLKRPNVSWFFDADQNTPESIWFSEDGHIPSPIYILNQVQEALKAENPTVELKKLIVLTSGSLMDAAEAQDICAQNDVQLVQFNNAEMPDLPTLQTVIESTFDKKEMENE